MYAPSQWETTLQCNAVLMGWAHTQKWYLRNDTSICHYDVIKRKHFPRYWPFARGIHRSPVNSPHKGQWRWALMFSSICARINGWVNNHEAGVIWEAIAPIMTSSWWNHHRITGNGGIDGPSTHPMLGPKLNAAGSISCLIDYHQARYQ